MNQEINKKKFHESFKVPEGYFESNEINLLKISSESKKDRSKLIQLLAPISIAAAIVLGFFLYTPTVITHESAIDNSISSVIIEDYLQTNYTDAHNLAILTELISDETLEIGEIELLSYIDITEDMLYELNYNEYIYYENL